MNPILNLVKNQRNQQQQQIPNDMGALLANLRSGKIDAKQSSLDIIKNMSPQQKDAVRQMLPQLTKLGKVFGVSDEKIDSFSKELQSSL